MLTCKQTSELATDRAEGALNESARIAFDEHLRGCEGCSAYVRQLDMTRQALGRLPEPAISPALNDALLAGFDAWAAARDGSPAKATAPDWRFSPWPAAAALGMVVLLLVFARQRSQAPEDWAIGAVLALAALAVASLAGRFAAGVVVAAVAAAAAAAIAGGSAGALDLATGAECLVVVLASAGLVAGAAWLGVRGGSRLAVRSTLAMGGLAGSLAADAALQLTCHAHGALPHLLSFHLGGVVLVAAAAAAVVRSARVPSRP
jgi:hypothetical protein